MAMDPDIFALVSVVVIDGLFGLFFGVLYGMVWLTNVSPGKYILKERLGALVVIMPAILIIFPTQVFIDMAIIGDAQYTFKQSTIMMVIFGPFITSSLFGIWASLAMRNSISTKLRKTAALSDNVRASHDPS